MDKHKEEAQRLVDYSISMLSVQFDSDAKVMNRSRCLAKGRMIARSHINFLIRQPELNPELYSYWQKVEQEIDKCF